MKMNAFGKSCVSLLALVALVAFASPAAAAKPAAGGNTSCKGDKGLDVPMQFVVQVQSGGRVHVSAFGGSDKSGLVSPEHWRIYNASGALIDYFPRTNLVFVSPD